MEKQSSIIMLDYSLWTEDISIEMGLEPVPLQLQHIATRRNRNLDGWNGGCNGL